MKFGSITTGIIADGLVFNIDAANRASYVPNTTTSYNTIDLSQSGSLVNNPTYISPPISASCWDFDGVDDYVDCGDFSAYDNGDLSVSVWVKKSSMQTYEYVVSNCGSSARAGFDIIFENAYRRLSISRRTRTSDTVTAYLDIGFTLNTWHNISFTYKDSTRTLKVYRDGILQSTTIGSASTNSASLNLTIGSYQGSSNFAIGNIANVHIYNRTLSANEVLHNYNALKNRFI